MELRISENIFTFNQLIWGLGNFGPPVGAVTLDLKVSNIKLRPCGHFAVSDSCVRWVVVESRMLALVKVCRVECWIVTGARRLYDGFQDSVGE